MKAQAAIPKRLSRYNTVAWSTTNMHKLLAVVIMVAAVGLVAAGFGPTLVQPVFAPTGTCNGCAKVVAPGTESGTGGTIGGGHEPAKAFAPGQISSGSASDAAPGHVKP
jgi:hypothetical protein